MYDLWLVTCPCGEHSGAIDRNALTFSFRVYRRVSVGLLKSSTEPEIWRKARGSWLEPELPSDIMTLSSTPSLIPDDGDAPTEGLLGTLMNADGVTATADEASISFPPTSFSEVDHSLYRSA